MTEANTITVPEFKTIDAIQTEIAEWSAANFGVNRSKHPKFHMASHDVPDLDAYCANHGLALERYGVPLHSLCAVLGIVEEIGELVSAKCTDEAKDAYGDVMVYACDYAGREGFKLSDCVSDIKTARIGWAQSGLSRIPALTAAAGRLCHVTLKRHQGIRGMDNDTQYHSARDTAMVALMNALAVHLDGSFPNLSLTACLNVTWEREVSKRNWKKNNQTGTTV